jgi:alanyl-tRNA synthetase
VLRRIARRALRHGHKLGQSRPFFHRIVPDLVEAMGEAYPELREAQARVMDVLRQEEERFGETLEHGMQILNAALASGAQVLDGETAFKLYDTYGFPLDLTADVCRERGVEVDSSGFDAAMTRQRETARAAGKFRMGGSLDYSGVATQFHGYEQITLDDARVSALYVDGVSVNRVQAGQDAVVVLEATPFYAESGGQAGDQGQLESAGARFEVLDTLKVQADVFGHHGRLVSGQLSVGETVNARVDAARRARTMRHHSATHLMHAALREVLGTHVQQKGSLVDADKTRFDFSHNAPMTAEQIRAVEQRVNGEILANAATSAQVMAFDDAVAHGAMALFGEKYGDSVRVLDIGSSRELCGGTHVGRTGDIGLFKIVTEGGVAAGIRRVEAVTGDVALGWVQDIEHTLQGAAAAFKAPVNELSGKIEHLLEANRAAEKEIVRLKSKLASSQGDDLMAAAVKVKDLNLLTAVLDGADARALRETLDKLKDKLRPAVIVLASVADGKVQLAAGVSPEAVGRIKAGELVNFVAQQVGGKGGGKPDLAMAGGTDPKAVPGALASVQGWVAERA